MTQEKKDNQELSDIDVLWQQSGGNDLLDGKKNFQEAFMAVSPVRLKEATSIFGDTLTVVCMDGRLDLTGTTNPIQLPGGGILNSEEDLEALACSGKKIVLMSHPGCGAAGALAEQEKRHFESPEDKNLYADQKVQALVDKYKNSFQFGGRTPLAEQFHTERVIYLPDLEVLKMQNLSELPQGYVINARYYKNWQLLLDHTEVGVDIYNQHGFGKYQKGPLSIVTIATDPIRAKKLSEVVQQRFESNSSIVLDNVFLKAA